MNADFAQAGLAWSGPDVTSAKGAGDENFPVGTVLIAREKRAQILAYYNFARAVDDMVDNASLPPEAKIARLEAMAAIVRGEETGPERADARTAAVLRPLLIDAGIPLETATDLTIAFVQDATKTRYESWGELLEYCRYSANPVGHFLLHLHQADPRSHAPSDALCTALQILNHLQDVTDDLKTLDRCYIPQAWLAEAGVTTADLRLARAKPGVRRVFDRMLDGVDRLNRDARALPGFIADRRMRLYAAVVVELSHRLAIRLRKGDPIAGRVKVTQYDGMLALARGLRVLP